MKDDTKRDEVLAQAMSIYESQRVKSHIRGNGDVARGVVDVDGA